MFVLINLSIDVYMLVKLRRTLNEKIARFSSLGDSKNLVQKELEMRDSINNAIRMVVVNSVLNICFKLPQALVPFENAVLTFQFKKPSKECVTNCKNVFFFFARLRDSRLHYLIPDLSDLLYTILIFIQIFLLSRFDKKIRIGLDRLFEAKKNSCNIIKSLKIFLKR